MDESRDTEDCTCFNQEIFFGEHEMFRLKASEWLRYDKNMNKYIHCCAPRYELSIKVHLYNDKFIYREILVAFSKGELFSHVECLLKDLCDMHGKLLAKATQEGILCLESEEET